MNRSAARAPPRSDPPLLRTRPRVTAGAGGGGATRPGSHERGAVDAPRGRGEEGVRAHQGARHAEEGRREEGRRLHPPPGEGRNHQAGAPRPPAPPHTRSAFRV